ncbi:hypothetical protein GGR54DRAFT_636509 [Hypoxylon sp. NC1633]|nr:hypothetical protein GGR54DRAFT_636509 [Hypoxylon sp. NC1633]
MRGLQGVTLGSLPPTKTLVLSIVPVLASIYLIYKFSPLSGTPSKRKRTQSEAASDQAGPVWSPKRNRWMSENDDASESSDGEETVIGDMESDRPLFDYYCMFRPFFDIENENRDKVEAERVGEDDLLERYNREIRAENNIEMEPAADHPEHRWITMWRTWKQFTVWERRAAHTNPDFYNMYISKHFHGFGMQEMVENMLIAFDKQFSKKKRDKKNVKKTWATVAAMMQWFTEIPLNSWIMMNEKKKLEISVNLVGRALVSVLNELDRTKMLKADSDIKDLGLVISFFLYWLATLEEVGIELSYRKEVVAYARKAGLDLKEVGCYGTDERIKALEREFGRIKPFSGSAKPDRWEWKKKFKKFSKDYKIGGEKYNILKMSRKERASYAFDKKDPLAEFSDKALQDGAVRAKPRRGH